jgi:hypothetical protein
MDKNIFKVKDNLYVEGNKVISYVTVVAIIKGDSIIELGKFSRTTTKHIFMLSQLMSKKIVHTTKKRREDFDKFNLGVKTSYDNCIGQKASLMILESLGKGIPYNVTLATLKGKIAKRDWELLDKEGIDPELLKGGSLLSRVGIY